MIFFATVAIAALCVAILLFAAGFHLFWAFGGRTGADISLPQGADGSPIIPPTRSGSFLVGVILGFIALLTLSVARLLQPSVPASWHSWSLGLCALGFAARTVGDFRYVGLFRNVRNTDFARYDQALYTPLSLVLALGLASLTWLTRL